MLAFNWDCEYGWPRRRGEAYVYVMLNVSLGYCPMRFKIGVSRSPLMRSLDVGRRAHVLFAAHFPEECAYSVEKQLHRMYASKRTTGEWFSLSPSDLGVIAYGLCLVADSSKWGRVERVEWHD